MFSFSASGTCVHFHLPVRVAPWPSSSLPPLPHLHHLLLLLHLLLLGPLRLLSPPTFPFVARPARDAALRFSQRNSVKKTKKNSLPPLANIKKVVFWVGASFLPSFCGATARFLLMFFFFVLCIRVSLSAPPHWSTPAANGLCPFTPPYLSLALHAESTNSDNKTQKERTNTKTWFRSRGNFFFSLWVNGRTLHRRHLSVNFLSGRFQSSSILNSVPAPYNPLKFHTKQVKWNPMKQKLVQKLIKLVKTRKKNTAKPSKTQ